MMCSLILNRSSAVSVPRGDAQVVDLAVVVEVLRHLHAWNPCSSSPRVARSSSRGTMCSGLSVKQRFLHRQRRRPAPSLLAQQLAVGQARPVVQVTHPGLMPPISPDPLDHLLRHRLFAQIAAGDELEVVADPRPGVARARGSRCSSASAGLAKRSQVARSPRPATAPRNACGSRGFGCRSSPAWSPCPPRIPAWSPCRSRAASWPGATRTIRRREGGNRRRDPLRCRGPPRPACAPRSGPAGNGRGCRVTSRRSLRRRPG